MTGFVCYVCKEQMQQNELSIPFNIHVVMPFGNLNLTVLMHYMCALDYFLSTLNQTEALADKDRIDIESKLMAALTLIAKGTIQ